MPRLDLLVGTYAFSHDGFIFTKTPFNSPGIPTLPAYELSGTPPAFTQIGGFAVEGAVGHMVFSGDGTVAGAVHVYQHGIAMGSTKQFTGTYTIQTEHYDIKGSAGSKVIVPGVGHILVHTGTISTVTGNVPLMDYYFVAADKLRELKFMLTIPANAARPFSATGVMVKCE